mmetsp:Transcript_18354/g.54533  ORF Transcript_18354/g.54533 Transcript_18354/m.54533 type:complete len:531 (+) Transcript_18354:166-1758(+)
MRAHNADPFSGSNYEALLADWQIYFVLCPCIAFFVLLPSKYREQALAFLGSRCGCTPEEGVVSRVVFNEDEATGDVEGAPKDEATASTPLLKADASSKPSKPRMTFVDNLRVFLTFLVVAHHCAGALSLAAWGGPSIYEVPGPAEWASGSDFPFLYGLLFSPTIINWFDFLNQSYFMATFFFISGIFTPKSFRKKGWTKFLEDKMLRLAVPAVVWYMALGPLFVRSFSWMFSEVRVFPWKLEGGPPWFIKMLALYNLVYACGPRLLPEKPKCPSIGVALAVGFVSGCARSVLSVSGSTILNPRGLEQFQQYVLYFVAGCAAGDGDWLPEIVSMSAGNAAFLRGICLIYAVAGYFLQKAMWSDRVKNYRDLLKGDPTPYDAQTNAALAPVFVAFSGVFSVAITLVWLQLFHQYFNSAKRFVTRALSDAAYAAYLLHPFGILFALWTLHQVFKAEGYDIGQRVPDTDVTARDLDPKTRGAWFVPSQWDDDADSKAWGYKTWSGFLYLVVVANLVTWPISWCIKKLPGVRNVL